MKRCNREKYARFRTGEKGPSHENDGKGPNLHKPQCIDGAKARKDGESQDANPFPKNTQSNRRWNRGWVNANLILDAKPKAKKAAKKVAAKKKKTSKAKS